MRVFVFGSNLAGMHAGGAARFAVVSHGAILGIGVGPQGGSYALPTMDCDGKQLPLDTIALYVEQFKKHAAQVTDEFQVTKVGCGIAGFDNADIAPMFVGAPKNCLFDQEWFPWLGDGYRYWGTK